MVSITLAEYAQARAVLYDDGYTSVETKLVTLESAQPCAAFYHAISSVETIEAGRQAVMEVARYTPEPTCIECVIEAPDMQPKTVTRYTCINCVLQALRDIAIDAALDKAGNA